MENLSRFHTPQPRVPSWKRAILLYTQSGTIYHKYYVVHLKILPISNDEMKLYHVRPLWKETSEANLPIRCPNKGITFLLGPCILSRYSKVGCKKLDISLEVEFLPRIRPFYFFSKFKTSNTNVNERRFCTQAWEYSWFITKALPTFKTHAEECKDFQSINPFF